MNSKISNFKTKNLIKLKFVLFASFLLYFFSNSLIYAQNDEKFDSTYLIPIGQVLQIDTELENIIVRNYVEGSPFMLGDSLLSVNNVKINNYGDFANFISSLNSNDDISILIRRGQNEFTINTNKEELEKVNFNNLLSGFATLTYINPDTKEFGAVGHPISVGTARKIPIKNGYISTTQNLIIQKSSKGNVGSLSAKKKDTIGKFTTNTDFGIRGNVVSFDTTNLKRYKVASLNDIKIGKAQIILQTDLYDFKTYDIQIVDIENQKHPKQKTFKIKLTDKNLLSQTGGIVQGMSGTPIIQNNKIIGAISHAVENDPTLGYAVFIQWMLEN